MNKRISVASHAWQYVKNGFIAKSIKHDTMHFPNTYYTGTDVI